MNGEGNEMPYLVPHIHSLRDTRNCINEKNAKKIALLICSSIPKHGTELSPGSYLRPCSAFAAVAAALAPHMTSFCPQVLHAPLCTDCDGAQRSEDAKQRKPAVRLAAQGHLGNTWIKLAIFDIRPCRAMTLTNLN